MTTTRRRFLTIMAGCLASAPPLAAARAEPLVWRGRALGAEPEVRLFGTDRDQVKQALLAARDTILRMENLFSLYLPKSALNQLNASGSLTMPPEFARLMGIVDKVHEASSGLFDPTVQPMMVALARTGQSLSVADLQSLAERIGWNKVRRHRSELSFSVPGMALTLNGIAQGFATDRVSEVLNAHGFDPHLVPCRRVPRRFEIRAHRYLKRKRGPTGHSETAPFFCRDIFTQRNTFSERQWPYCASRSRRPRAAMAVCYCSVRNSRRCRRRVDRPGAHNNHGACGKGDLKGFGDNDLV